MTTPRVLVAALLAASMSFFAAPASGQDYGEFGVFGSPNGTFEEGDDIEVEFEAVNLDCNSWTVLSDDTGEAPSGGPGGDELTFEVSPDEGTYSITARCNTSQPTSAPAQAGVTQVEPASYVQGAGETQDTITFTVVAADDDDDDGDDDDGDDDGDGGGGGGNDDKAGDLPDTGGENRGLLLIGGGLALAGAATIAIARRRNAA